MKPALITAACLAGLTLLAAGPAEALTPPPVEKARLVHVNGEHLVAIDADGGDRQVLTHREKSLAEYDDQTDYSPRVSPDGSSLLFLRDLDSDAQGEITKLMVASMDGTGVHAVTTTDRLESKKRLAPQTDLVSAAWSQDGSRIVFSQTDSGFWMNGHTRWKSRIRSIKPDATGLKTILTSRLKRSREKGLEGKGLFGDIDISATDGRALVTRELVAGGRSDLQAIDLKSGRTKRLVRSAREGRWSPDGSSILFLSDRDETGKRCYEGGCDFQVKLYTARADGSGQRLVQGKKQAGTLMGADWSPDGSRIAFGSDRNMPGWLGMSMEIYSIKPDGSCLTWLTNGSPASADPNWSPQTGFDSDPGACGATEREVTIDPSPSEHPIVDEEPAKWPTLWVGPVYEETTLVYPDEESGYLSYFDCASFVRKDCQILSYLDLRSRDVCSEWSFIEALDKGNYRGMVMRRGAVLTKPVFNSSDYRDASLLTGGQAIAMSVETLFQKPTRFSEYLDVVDLLRPVGHDELLGQELQPAVFDRNVVNRSIAITMGVKRAGSVRKYIGDANPASAKTIRAYLRFNRDFNRLGPFRTANCPADR